MNLPAALLAAAAVLALVAAIGALVLPERARVVFTGCTTAVMGCAVAAVGVAALSGRSVDVAWNQILPLAGVQLHLDPLGGWFLTTTGIVLVLCAIYGIGYSEHAVASRTFQATFPLFGFSMVVVLVASSITTFLFAWELMALSSLLLVLVEHRNGPEVQRAGTWYAVMTHFGFIAVLIAFCILSTHAHGESFAALQTGASHLSEAWRSVVFVLAVVGFGSKAGMVPLHVWLPRAHPEAPSHVSALMSGAMVKVGIYGLIRVGIVLLGPGPRWWGMTLLGLGAASALFGILHALVETDLKVLLAYSTTENIGLILIGIGASLMLTSDGHPALGAALMAAALLHVLNHAVFKALLFLGAGSAIKASGTRNLDEMGGLLRRMPATGACFAVGALAIIGLPPLNGFVSEWLLLQGLVHAGVSGSTAITIAMPLAVAAVALTTGLAAATFVKALGTGFLALPRSRDADVARETRPTMVVAMTAAAAACVVLGLLPAFVAVGVSHAVTITVAGQRSTLSVGNGFVQLAAIRGAISPTLLALVLLGAVVGLLALWRATGAALTRRRAENWACGRSLQTARMEYTATSFAEPLQRVFDDVLRPSLDVDVTHATESRWYLESVRYRSRVRDSVEQYLFVPAFALVRRIGESARALHNGSVRRYLAYGFVALCVVLIAAR